MDEHREAYKEEAYELLAELETSLLELETRPDDTNIIGRVFRAMHTIKGSGAMFGFDEISAFTHEIETVFDLVRNGKIPVTKELINLTLDARDHICTMLDSSESENLLKQDKSQKIITSFKNLVPESDFETPDNESNEEIAIETESLTDDKTYGIRFRPAQDIFLRGIDPVTLINELRELGDCKIIAHANDIPCLDTFNPEACYTSWDITLTTRQELASIQDVFIFVEDDSEINIRIIDEEEPFDSEGHYKKLGEILIERGDITHKDLDKALEKQKRIGELLVEDCVVESGKVKSALMEQEHVKNKHKTDKVSSIRVASDKLDVLVDLVGELVTIQSRLSQTASNHHEPELLTISEEVERLTAELRDNTMSIRMLPIGTTFSKFKRLVRDLSNELGKKVEIVTDGADTELDKTVIERLNDPLVHLIRNCIDHGIESPEVREAAGKPRMGTVHLSALHSGANVLIKIRDDGAGLDNKAIRAKAVKNGIITPDAELSEKETFSLIFAPGFSTAKNITSVSGRGVGLDVVKQAIEVLQGAIEVNSQKDVGTTITLKLPLTLAIIEGLLVMTGDDYFVLPLSAVQECVELSREDIARTSGRKIANVRGEIVPYVHLRERFIVTGKSPDIEQIVIVAVDGKRVGIVVDQVIGEHQTVIKSLGKFYKDIKEISGATILGDGTVALILDLMRLVQEAEIEEKNLVGSGNQLQSGPPEDVKIIEEKHTLLEI